MSCVFASFRCILLFFALFAMSQTLATPAKSPAAATPIPTIDSQHCNNVYFYEAPNSKIETLLQEMKKQLTQVQADIDILKGNTTSAKAFSKACTFDFEAGLHDWKRTGTAFNNQPTYGDNPTARNRGQPAKQQGNWWIGGFENRPCIAATAGKLQGDGPQGTLTSPFFKIIGKHLSFLIGGGCDNNTVRAELLIGHQVVKKATGACTETMTRKTWDVHAFVGQKARVKLVDFSSASWGHINFDDLKGDISCA